MAVEVDEVELQRLQKQDRTVHAMMANPKAKKKILEAYKEHDPTARIPELEIEEASRKPVIELQETVAKLQKKIEDDADERAKNATLSSIKDRIESSKLKFKRAGWFDEDLEKVERLMEEKGTTDFELAAAYYEKQHPPALPATPRGTGTWDFSEAATDDDAYTKALLADKNASGNDALAIREANKILNEIRGATRR